MVSEEQAEAFAAALELAHKVLNDREPEAKDKLRSLVDQDVRTGKHGDYYDGLLTGCEYGCGLGAHLCLDVLPANADEAANAKQLIARKSTPTAMMSPVSRSIASAIVATCWPS